MTASWRVLLGAVCTMSPCAAQAPAFAVASVRMTPEIPPGGDVPPQSIIANPGSLIMRNVSMRAVLSWAYDVKVYQISCPAWMGTPAAHGEFPRYEIAAKAADGVSVAELKLMLQSLLAERFRLMAHRESSVIPVLDLAVVRRNSALRSSDAADEKPTVTQNGVAYTWRRASMGDFAEFLSQPMGMPIIDNTGLKGRFDFTVDLSTYASSPGFIWRDAFEDALRTQLGLELEHGKASIEMLVVDRAEKTPTGN